MFTVAATRGRNPLRWRVSMFMSVFMPGLKYSTGRGRDFTLPLSTGMKILPYNFSHQCSVCAVTSLLNAFLAHIRLGECLHDPISASFGVRSRSLLS